MSADKRTVSTDALETLGMIHTRDEKRDAIHLAVVPVVAGTTLQPGQHITISADGQTAFPSSLGRGMAIVDPFLPRHADVGERFWAVIYPRVITSLRHVWTHPAIPDEAGVSGETGITRESAIAWLTEYAAGMGASYDELIYALENYGTFDGQPDYYSRNPQDCRPYYIAATGKAWGLDGQDYFSCSC